MCQIEAWIEAERHDGGCSVRGALTSEYCHLTFAVHSNGVVAGGQWKNAVQMVTLNPILQLTGHVAGILPYLKHRYHNDFYWNGPLCNER